MTVQRGSNNESRRLACEEARELTLPMLDEMEKERWCATPNCGAEVFSLDPLEITKDVYYCEKCYRRLGDRRRAIAKAKSAEQGTQRQH